jgi:hypothetical protein
MIQLRKGQRFVFIDYLPLSTKPTIRKGDVVTYLRREDDKVFVRHKKKIVSFHITNITKEYFERVKL